MISTRMIMMMTTNRILDLISANPKKEETIITMDVMAAALADLLITIIRETTGIMMKEICQTKIEMEDLNFENKQCSINNRHIFVYVSVFQGLYMINMCIYSISE